MSNIRRTAAIGLVVVSVAAVVVSLVLVGSPSQARLERYDQQRVADLQNIENIVLLYAARQYRLSTQTDLPTGSMLLPEKLADVASLPGTGEIFIEDPITRSPYEYQRTGDLRYELCATFDASSGIPSSAPTNVPNESWDHPAGHYCFPRSIDPAQLPDSGVPVGKPYPMPVAPLPQ